MFRVLFLKALRYLTDNRGASGAAATDEDTLTECVPTIIAAALLELEEGNIVEPLVTDVPFPGPGLVHQTPFIAKITAETDDSLAYQSMDSTTPGGIETSPSSATIEQAVMKTLEPSCNHSNSLFPMLTGYFQVLRGQLCSTSKRRYLEWED